MMRFATLLLGGCVGLLAGCSGEQAVRPVHQDQNRAIPDLSWTFDPVQLELGDVDLGQTVEELVRLENTSTADLLVLEVEADLAAGFDVLHTGALAIPPGGTTDFLVSWTPRVPGSTSSDIRLTLGTSPDSPHQAAYPTTGTGLGAALVVSTDSYDFGGVNIGCEDELSLTFTNTGNASVEVLDLFLEGDPSFTLDQEPELPFTLGPYGSHQLAVRFTPVDRRERRALVELRAGDAVLQTGFAGTGAVEQEQSLSFDVEGIGRTTALFHVNDVAIEGVSWGIYGQTMTDALPFFFDTLLENRAPFRVAFLVDETGVVRGDAAYIDDSFTSSEAVSTALDMMAGGATMADNDMSFRTLSMGLAENESWLMEDAWANSKLNLIGINNDVEQSGSGWASYVAEAQALKDDPEDAVFHAIGGPVPGGCGSADPFMGFADAVAETGGVFLSICQTDWSDHMAQLAAASMKGAPFFPLDGTPLESSIDVFIDDARTPDWTYDAALNAVVFEESDYPPTGSEVRIDYWMANSCE